MSDHDPRCISLTSSEFNTHCDCRTLRAIDAHMEHHHPDQPDPRHGPRWPHQTEAGQ